MKDALKKIIRQELRALKESFDFPAWERDYHDTRHYNSTKPVVTDKDLVSFKFIAEDKESFMLIASNEYAKEKYTKLDEPTLTITFENVPKNVVGEIRRIVFSESIGGSIKLV
jgi:hypothetical protein